MSRLIRVLPSLLGSIIGTVGFLLVTAAVSKPQAKPVGGIPDEIEAKKIVTQRVEIQPRVPGGVAGSLSSTDSGEINLIFYGPDSAIRAMLSSSKDGKSELALNDSRGTWRVVLDSEPSIRIYDDKMMRVAIGQRDLTVERSGVKERTRPGILIFDEVGKVVWQEPR